MNLTSRFGKFTVVHFSKTEATKWRQKIVETIVMIPCVFNVLIVPWTHAFKTIRAWRLKVEIAAIKVFKTSIVK